MLVIRLRRGGKKHEPHFRIVIQEKRSKLNGKYLDSIGHYHPLADKDNKISIDKEKASGWLKKGAKPSVTITNLFVKEGILEKEEKISKVFHKNKKKLAKNKKKNLESPKQTSEVKEKTKEKSEETLEQEQNGEKPEEIKKETTEQVQNNIEIKEEK